MLSVAFNASKLVAKGSLVLLKLQKLEPKLREKDARNAIRMLAQQLKLPTTLEKFT